MSAPKQPDGAPPANPAGFLSIGNASSYLDMSHRYLDLVGEIVPIALRSRWESKEVTSDALRDLVDRLLPEAKTMFARDRDKDIDR